MRARRRTRPVCVLTVAGSDSGGGAGIQADLLTFAAHGLYGATVVVAGTAQNTRRIAAVEAFSPRFVRQQLDAVLSDLAPAAVKIGMLGDAGHVRAVASALTRHRPPNVVLDPVFAATSGTRLLSRDGIRALRDRLLPLCDVVTPNLEEASKLAGIAIRSDTDRAEAARRIADLGPRAVLITGGHGPGNRVRDVLWDGRRFRVFDHRRIDTLALHGTGCVLSAALAANLALGFALEDAAARAIRYVSAALRRGVFPGTGMGTPGHPFTNSRSGTPSPRKRPPRSQSGRRRARRTGRGSSPSP
jgi:hydroxymethylpyrimidine/phosphomethylpyrimidine kinase